MKSVRTVCVLGMHRSGTSLTAGLINMLGVYLGPESDLVHPLGENCECNNDTGGDQSLKKCHFLRNRLIVLGLMILMSLVPRW